MALKKEILGKIFISHSPEDKRLGRKLRNKLQRAGYDTWLYEDELFGYHLRTHESKAIEEVKIFLAVVSSANNVRSNWLRFELANAIEMMIKGECRVVAIIKENMEDYNLSAEVTGLAQINFTTSFKVGYEKLIMTLQHEYNKEQKIQAFWWRAKKVVGKVFGDYKLVATGREYRTFDYTGFNLPYLIDDCIDLFVVYESVSKYSKEVKPLDLSWWSKYQAENQKNDENYLFLVITERPISFRFDYVTKKSERVKGKRLFEDAFKPHVVVFVDLSGLDISEWEFHIQAAKDELIDYSLANLNVSDSE